MDRLGGTRKQFMSVYVQILDHITKDKKSNLAGQISLFDIAAEEDKDDFDIKMPDVGEYNKEMLLTFEKEVLGIYVSGHPLQEYEGLITKNVTAYSNDFILEEESESVRVKDGSVELIGGIIQGINVKMTRNNTQMAFLTLEDTLGSVEVILFPRDYEKYRSIIAPERKVFVRGRVSVEEEKDAKLIAQEVIPFEQVPRELWIQFSDKAAFLAQEQELYDSMKDSDGQDSVCIYCAAEKAVKRLPVSRSVQISTELLDTLREKFGEKNIKIVEKSIDNRRKMH